MLRDAFALEKEAAVMPILIRRNDLSAVSPKADAVSPIGTAPLADREFQEVESAVLCERYGNFAEAVHLATEWRKKSKTPLNCSKRCEKLTCLKMRNQDSFLFFEGKDNIDLLGNAF